MRIDEFLPRYDVHEFHATRVQAPCERVWRAVLEMPASELPAVRLMMALRRLDPGLLRARDDGPMLAGLAANGFVELAREPGREIVVGIVGQFWRLRPERVRCDNGAAFTAFERPGFAKAVMNFCIDGDAGDDGALRLTTETRVRATDGAARRRFALYWKLVHPGSAFIRVLWLRAVRRRAERGPAGHPAP